MAKFRVIGRANALDSELSRFYTGRRCHVGHLAERYTTSGNCVECDRRRATNNMRKYRRKLKANK